MLEDLTIKNFALIDSATIEFEKGFTVLSGETGAGKSILIGALSFLLGGKADSSLIRTGSQEASVSGTFVLKANENTQNSLFQNLDDEKTEAQNAWEWLTLHGIEVENNRVLLRRFLRDNGKTGARIGDTPVTRLELAEFSSFLVDIHGQHEHQSLMKVSEHRKYLDSFSLIVDEVSNFTLLYSSLVEKRRMLNSMNTSESERKQKIDLLQFAINEIESAKLKSSEDVDLEAEESKLASFEKLYSEIETVNALFSGDELSSFIPLSKKLRAASERASSLDQSLSSLDSRVENLFYEISDISEEFHSYENSLVFDPARLEEVQERLALIYKLKKKYASSPTAPLLEVTEYAEKAKIELENLSLSQENKSSLQKETEELEKKVYEKAKIISYKRKESASKMSLSVEEILSKLGMKGTKFSVNIQEKDGNALEQKCGPYGIDNIEFLISANPGSPLLPLAKIASGGELSRVMLALKTVFAATDMVDTLIFDEIDTGIGGEIAVSIGSHLKRLANNKQILCITHLASIAVYADNQIKIEKGVSGGITSSSAHTVTGNDRIAEIARMLSGDSASSESLEHAKSLLNKYSVRNLS